MFFGIPLFIILAYVYEAAHGDADAKEELKRIMDDDEVEELIDKFGPNEPEE